MSKDDFKDELSRTKGPIPFPTPPRADLDFSQPDFITKWAQRQLEQARQALDDQFIAETIAKMSAILKDQKHPAHHTVRRLVLEAQNVATRP